MLTIEFNSESINTFLSETLSEPITLHNSFLDIDDNLEKLNSLKTEFAYALKDQRTTGNPKFIEVFDLLQQGEYIILNERGELVYEGISFSDTPAEIPTIAKPTNELTIFDLLNERKELQQKLVVVNAHIVNNLTSSLDIFDDVIAKLEDLKGTWAERIDKMLGVANDIEEEEVTAFSDMITSLKAIQDKLSSEVL